MNTTLKCGFSAVTLLVVVSTAHAQTNASPRSFSVVRGSGKWDVSGLLWSPNGKQLAVVTVRSFENVMEGIAPSESYSVQIWNTHHLRPQAVVRSATERGSGIPLQQMVFSPDSALLALDVNTKGVNEGVPIWRTRSGRLVKVLKIWSQPLAFHSNRQIIAIDNDTINYGGSVEFGLEYRDVKRDRVLRRIRLLIPKHRYTAYARASSGGGGEPLCLLSPNGQQGALLLWKPRRGNSHGAETLLFDPHTGRWHKILRFGLKNFEPVSFSWNGNRLGMVEYWSENAGRAGVVDCKSGRLLSMLEAPAKDSVKNLALSADGRTVAIATERGVVQLRQSVGGQLIRTLQTEPRIVTALVFSPDGQTLAVGEEGGAVRLWKVQPN